METIDEILKSNKTSCLFIGNYATGKTTFYNTYLKDTAKIQVEEKVSRKTFQSIENMAISGLNITIDGNNPQKKDRKPIIETLKKKDYQIFAFYFCSITRDCIVRNRKRRNTINENKIIKTEKLIELPNLEEGFSKIFYVELIDNNFNIENWV